MTKDFVNNWSMTSTRRRPTEAELGILRVLWEGGPRSVRDIQRILNEARPTGYTTVLKLMQIMTDKGLVERDESQRPADLPREVLSGTNPAAVTARFDGPRVRRLGEGSGAAGPGHQAVLA